MLVLLLVFSQILACGTSNLAVTQTKLSLAERARLALEQGDYDQAVDLYEQAIAEQPTDDELKRYLSASLAARAGFSISTLIEKQIGSLGEQSNDPLGFVGDSLPTDPSSENLSDIAAAIEVLEALDPSFLESDEGSSVSLQISLYQAAYSLMYIKRFDQRNEDGTIDRQRLESMSEDDAQAILNNLESIASGSEDEALAAEVEKLLAEIDGQEGSTQKEKLSKYIQANAS